MTEPTDAEIDALWVGQQLTVPQLVQRRVIARAAQDGGDVAMTTTQVEHAQPEALRGAPPSAYSQEDRAFYTFWYGHMLNDLMQPPLAGVSHATARYIWDAAIAHAAAPAQAADSVLEDAGGANWQDISTAPKDGTRILLHPAVEVHDAWSKCYWSEQHKCWIVGGSASGVTHTHWMPLPLPPTTSAGSGKGE